MQKATKLPKVNATIVGNVGARKSLQGVDLLQKGRDDLIVFSALTMGEYRPNWHHIEIARKLEAVERGEIKRLMIFMPPRHGKSQLASINFPAWYLGRNPGKEVIMASYSAELATSFGYKARELVASDAYRALFPYTNLKQDTQRKDNWEVTTLEYPQAKPGSFLAAGVGGPITGKGANVLLIDDPVKNREEANSETVRNSVYSWYTSTAFSRLEKGGAVILILTRWHLDDLAGRILENSPEGQWEVIDYPAIAMKDEARRKKGEALWPQKYDLEALEEIKQTVGPMDWASLYQQVPISAETQEFKEEYFRYFNEADLEGKNLRYYISVDPAISQKQSADNTAVVVVGKEITGPNWYIVDKVVQRMDPLSLIDTLFALYQKYRPVKIGIETVAYQKSLIYFLDEEMRKRGVYMPIEEIKNARTRKEERIRGLQPLFRTGVIHHRRSDKDLELELLTFPKGKHDDIIDSLAQHLQLHTPTLNMNRDDFAKRMAEKKFKKKWKNNARGVRFFRMA